MEQDRKSPVPTPENGQQAELRDTKEFVEYVSLVSDWIVIERRHWPGPRNDFHNQ